MKLPFTITAGGSVATLSDPHAIIKQKVIDVLTTSKRERVMEPAYGAGVYRFVYEILDPLVFSDFKVDALQELNQYITGATIMDLTIQTNDSFGVAGGNNTASITVYYKIPPLQATSMTFSISEFVVADTPV